MKKLTEQNIIEALGCPEDWDIPAIFEEIRLAYRKDSSHYQTFINYESVTIISAFTYEWKAGQNIHSERLHCHKTYKVRDDEQLSPMGVDEIFNDETEEFETFIIENYPLISTEYYI